MTHDKLIEDAARAIEARSWNQLTREECSELATAALADTLAEIDRYETALNGIGELAQIRIVDGDEMGARVWRIALQDICAEVIASLIPQEPS